MTACARMFKLLDELLAEKKSLDEIGTEMCDSVLSPRTKAIRLIKAHKGEAYLIENAKWLGYTEPKNSSGENQYSNQKNVVQQKEPRDEFIAEPESQLESIKTPACKNNAEKAMREQMEEDAENKRQELKYGTPVPGIDIPEVSPIGKPMCVQSHDLCDFWYAGGCNQDFDST